ncbi:zinc transporter 2-like isoform X1 [Penaeus chinensis]|uniref:zinc transporter 2-like isoform X1 n=1 Tax=Penaeus chinensis TaxID=139456 RepID=UPI001FB57921|nr:zinc transporter 2-like isoform X1 [Penaeus chinensis]
MEERPSRDDSSLNSENDDYEATNAIEADGVLDDKLLDAVTPRISVLDESVEEEDHPVKRTFCTRCRTISSSFLSTSYVSGSENLSGIERLQQPRNSQTRFLGDQGHPVSAGDSLEDSDDVPLLRVSHFGDEDGAENGHAGLGPTTAAAADHCHMPRASQRASGRAMTQLMLACCLTTIFMIAEAVGGYLASSIAIMSDAAHLFSDLTSFIVSLAAIYLSRQPASKNMSFGYYRAEVLGAVVSVLIIWVITGILVFAAVQRVISMDFEVEADTMIIVSALGVVINIILGIVLHMGQGGHGHSHGGLGGHGHSHGRRPSRAQGNEPQSSNINVRAAFIHVLGDLIQSIGVLIAAYVIRYYPQYKIADPICTFIFSVLVIITTLPILKDLTHVLMEGTPQGVDYASVSANLTALPGVKMVHSLNVWALTLDKNACAVHIAISGDTDPETVLQAAQRVIRTRHHIYHTTIQVERYQPQLMDNCQQCQPLSR